jgi:hypothetical protein
MLVPSNSSESTSHPWARLQICRWRAAARSSRGAYPCSGARCSFMKARCSVCWPSCSPPPVRPSACCCCCCPLLLVLPLPPLLLLLLRPLPLPALLNRRQKAEAARLRRKQGQSAAIVATQRAGVTKRLPPVGVTTTPLDERSDDDSNESAGGESDRGGGGKRSHVGGRRRRNSVGNRVGGITGLRGGAGGGDDDEDDVTAIPPGIAAIESSFITTPDAKLFYGSQVALQQSGEDAYLTTDWHTGKSAVHPLLPPELAEGITPAFTTGEKAGADGVGGVRPGRSIFTIMHLEDQQRATPVRFGDDVWLLLASGPGSKRWQNGSVLGAVVRQAPALGVVSIADGSIGAGPGSESVILSGAASGSGSGGGSGDMASQSFARPSAGDGSAVLSGGLRSMRRGVMKKAQPTSLSALAGADGSGMSGGGPPAGTRHEAGMPHTRVVHPPPHMALSADGTEGVRTTDLVGEPGPMPAFVPAEGQPCAHEAFNLKGPVTDENPRGMYSRRDDEWDSVVLAANALPLRAAKWRIMPALAPGVAGAPKVGDPVRNLDELYLEQDWFYIVRDTTARGGRGGDAVTLRQLPTKTVGDYCVERRGVWKLCINQAKPTEGGQSRFREMEQLLFKARSQLHRSQTFREGAAPGSKYEPGIVSGAAFSGQVRRTRAKHDVTLELGLVERETKKLAHIDDYFKSRAARLLHAADAEAAGGLPGGGGGSSQRGAPSLGTAPGSAGGATAGRSGSAARLPAMTLSGSSPGPASPAGISPERRRLHAEAALRSRTLTASPIVSAAMAFLKSGLCTGEGKEAMSTYAAGVEDPAAVAARLQASARALRAEAASPLSPSAATAAAGRLSAQLFDVVGQCRLCGAEHGRTGFDLCSANEDVRRMLVQVSFDGVFW